jgi:hypothetical protein
MAVQSMKKNKSTSGRWFFWSTIYDKSDVPTPYMTRIGFWRFRLHIFYRGDLDPDCHDHPWDFWTFPLTTYVEEVAYPNPFYEEGFPEMGSKFLTYTRLVRRFKLHFRPATHCHRVLGAWNGQTDIDLDGLTATGLVMPTHGTVPGKKILTLVWRSMEYRDWGFLKARDGKWCWTYWKDYVFGDGKDAPCK